MPHLLQVLAVINGKNILPFSAQGKTKIFVKGSKEANQTKARNKERNKILLREKERTTGTGLCTKTIQYTKTEIKDIKKKKKEDYLLLKKKINAG